MNFTSFIDDIPVTLARAAHSGTSMVPEERGAQERQDYAAELTRDYQNLLQHADTPEKVTILDGEFERYRARHRELTIAWLTSRSRCMSTLITGPSKFPTERNRKRNDSADRHLNELVTHRKRALEAMLKGLHPEWRPIMAGDADATERLQQKLAAAERQQEIMRAVNAAMRRRAKAGPEAQVRAMVEAGISEGRARELLKPDLCGRIGFADYELKNNGAEIRRLRARLGQVEQAKAAPNTELQGAHATMEELPGANRVRLYFHRKPPAEVRERLKRAGFRWTPTIGAWQAMRNTHSLLVARAEAGAPIEEHEQGRAAEGDL